MTQDEVKKLIISIIEIHQAYLGVDLKRELDEELKGKIDFEVPPLIDQLVKDQRIEKAEFLVPVPPDSWQHKSVYFPKGSQFWNTTAKFVTPH